MLETNSEKAFAGLIIFVAVLLLFLLFGMPQPTAEGYCTNDCTTHVTYSDTPIVDWSICGSGCLIEKITENYDTTHPEEFKIHCKCCECVGSNTLQLPECQGPFGWLYNLLGRCKYTMGD